ncbi:amidohydrolase family protein [Leucobacter sp. cx-42]|uniref:amidohydrolase family protein n=1 Tax=unclassified Leucobacter TaxID=2621730 RepID=UPI00165E5EE8|nr:MULTISPECIES: amidohydrolase family protein [unclassified Leucobacter]MBC9953772.1 amidohydrolase family protein [Leucobacter sp. cx-42]
MIDGLAEQNGPAPDSPTPPPRRTGRPRRPVLSEDLIARTALEIIDESEWSSCTMAAVARRLGVKTPSLYHHVNGQLGVVDLVRKIVVAEIHDPGILELAPTEAIWSFGVSYYRAFSRHPNTIEALTTTPVHDRQTIQMYETFLRALVQGGWDLDRAFDALVGLEHLALGFALEWNVEDRMLESSIAAGHGAPLLARATRTSLPQRQVAEAAYLSLLRRYINMFSLENSQSQRSTMSPQPQLVIHGAKIWSDGAFLEESAVAIADSQITALGGEELATQWAAADVPPQVINANGGLLTPGFVDAHVHTTIGGIERLRCDLTGCANADEVYAKIAEYAAEHPDLPWILGGGWRMPHFPGGLPRREDLDRIVPDRPVYLINADHHGAWANTLALDIAGITAETPDPVDGRIERDADGTPNGTLQEGAAELVGRAAPETTAAELCAGLLAGEQALFEAGVIGWQEAILGDYAGYTDFTPAYVELLERGELRGRASGALWVSRDFDGMTIPEFVADLERRRDLYSRDGLILNTAKIMVDGVPENETAAMNEPYEAECSCTGEAGLAYFSRDELFELVPLLNERGFNAHFHAIGDRAVRYALDALEAVPAEIRAARQNHIAHLQIIDPVEIPRFARLGVTANLQPLWAAQDQQFLDLTRPLLGEERSQHQYLFRSLELSGTPLACGSDWPVSTPNPWLGMHVAVNRQEPGVTDMAPLIPEEALTLASILQAYTRGSNELLGFGGGRIAVGAPADLALADRDPFAGEPADIWQTTNVATVVNGEVVFTA